MKIAVVGATGMVGNVKSGRRDFPVTELIPVASERSVGKEIEFKEKNIVVGSTNRCRHES
jgi:aspartate-semialdehyde dehydrogenase